VGASTSARAALGGRRRGVLDEQALQQRQGESGGLAGASLRAGEQVAAGQRGRNGGGLDRGGFGVALFGERTQQRGRKPEGFKTHVGSSKNANANGVCDESRSVPKNRAAGKNRSACAGRKGVFAEWCDPAANGRIEREKRKGTRETGCSIQAVRA
jgi:hypothetical protein